MTKKVISVSIIWPNHRNSLEDKKCLKNVGLLSRVIEDDYIILYYKV